MGEVPTGTSATTAWQACIDPSRARAIECAPSPRRTPVPPMKALSDIVMLDLTHMLSGPFAAMLLADLGAETIKIEPPGSGEMTRGLLNDDPRYAYKGMGPYFRTLNRNKKSVCIDLKRPEGRALFHELAATADIVVNNFRPGVTERLEHRPRDAGCDQPAHRHLQRDRLRRGGPGLRAHRLRRGGARLRRRHVDHRRGRRAADPRRRAHGRPLERALRRRRHAGGAARARGDRAAASTSTSPCRTARSRS